MNIAEAGHRLNVPEALKTYRQFVCWRRHEGRKIPVTPSTGVGASSTDPATWTSYDEAVQAATVGGYAGIGFVFTDADPFVFLDLDDCRDGDGWKAHANTWCAALPDAAWETSQSGNGLHAIARVSNKAALANKRKKWTDGDGNKYEFYTTGRFIAFGHCNWSRLDLNTDTPLLNVLVPNHEAADTTPVDGWIDAARPDYGGPANDDELLRRALEQKSPLAGLGKAASFAALYRGDAELGDYYPAEGRAFDHSSAEMALADALAWWTGCNPVRIERIMNGAPLCQRDKWQNRSEYRRDTINKAIADPNRAYMKTRDRREQRLQADMTIGDDLHTKPLPTIMSLDDMLRDLAHVGFGSQIIHRSSKIIRNKEDATSEYAASITEVDTGKIDREGNPVMKRHRTLELWRQHPNRTSVDVVTWQPGEAEICRALDGSGAGQRAYNLWTAPKPLGPPSNWQEWVKPLTDHVAYLVPVEAERRRFLQWLAHIIQKPGELPHTVYLMIATSTGIGRGTLASMLTRALRGYVAANVDVGILLDNGFNGRLSQKLLATVDEIREGGNARYQQQENFKSAVVEEVRHINPKFGRQHVEKNCCRWLLFSNHLDAIPFDSGDRRVIVIENPTTPAAPEWYEYLHTLLDKREFIASIQHYLATLDIADFKPGERAPMNAAKQRALLSMEAPADAAARQFRETWPGQLATVGDLREFLGQDAPAHPKAMRHVIERAGMLQMEKPIKIAGKTERIIIVNGLRPSDMAGIAPNEIAKRALAAQAAFRSQF